MNCKTAKLIDLVSYLKKQGFRIGKTNTKEVWFYSPFRDNERTPSFKINISKNVFFCHSSGIGGTIIDFIMKYNNCSIKEVLVILSKDTFSIHQQTKQIKNEPTPTYSIKKVTELTNQRLLNYLSNRKINSTFAKRFLSFLISSVKPKVEANLRSLNSNFISSSGIYVLLVYKFCSFLQGFKTSLV